MVSDTFANSSLSKSRLRLRNISRLAYHNFEHETAFPNKKKRNRTFHKLKELSKRCRATFEESVFQNFIVELSVVGLFAELLCGAI